MKHRHSRIEFVHQLTFLVLVLHERQLHAEHRLDQLDQDDALVGLDELTVDLRAREKDEER